MPAHVLRQSGACEPWHTPQIQEHASSGPCGQPFMWPPAWMTLWQGSVLLSILHLPSMPGDPSCEVLWCPLSHLGSGLSVLPLPLLFTPGVHCLLDLSPMNLWSFLVLQQLLLSQPSTFLPSCSLVWCFLTFWLSMNPCRKCIARHAHVYNLDNTVSLCLKVSHNIKCVAHLLGVQPNAIYHT